MARGEFLDGRIVLVTGAGSGIGRAIALAMASHGGRVFIAGRRSEALAQTVDLARERGGACESIIADVGSEEDAARIAGVVRARADGLDVLVNNAGVFRTGPVHEAPVETFDLVFRTNVRGVFLVTRAVAPLMAGRAGANIINISSIAGSRCDPGMGIYEASKAAVNTLTKVQAKELAPLGIRVNAIAPGPVETEGLYGEAEDPEARGRAREELAGAVPFGRLGRSEEIARLAVFLASPESDFISGSVTSIDGAMGY